MVKHTLFECVSPFCEIGALKGLISPLLVFYLFDTCLVVHLALQNLFNFFVALPNVVIN